LGRRKISDLFDSEMETKQRNREHYGSKIKKYRVRKGLSAEALALSLRVSLSTVRNWEAGISRPDLALLSRIFALLDVDPNEFFVLEGVGHAQMGEATAAVASWINENGYQVNDPMFNIYHVSLNETQNPDEYVIELCFPVE